MILPMFRLPNVASLAALALLVIPAVQQAVEQIYPAADWWWSPLIVTALGALAKAAQEWASASPKPVTPPPAPPPGVAMDVSGPAQPVQAEVEPLLKRVLVR